MEDLVFSIQIEDKRLIIALSGIFKSNSSSELWRTVFRMQKWDFDEIVVKGEEITYCDAAGFSFFLFLKQKQKRKEQKFTLHLNDPWMGLFSWVEEKDLFFPDRRKKEKFKCCAPEDIGKAFIAVWKDMREMISFLGEVLVKSFGMLRSPGLMRWGEWFFVMERSGANAFFIVSLIGLLTGLILAFQSAVQLDKFGAGVFAGDLVAISLIRELGPLLTAIIFAGRSGSAFAAEIGTMKVNEEIDALVTMGLDPVRFLVIPRCLAGIVVTPILTVYAMIIGLTGGAIVLSAIGYPLAIYIEQIRTSVDLVDFFGGVLKSFVFGGVIAGTGCLNGLKTKGSAASVGESATKAVVSGIIWIVIFDSLFSIIYYYLGI